MHARNEKELEILSLFKQYETADNEGKSRISAHLKAKYCNEEAGEAIYNSNVSMLADYEHSKNLNLPDYKDLRYSALYASAYLLAYVDNETGELFVTECAPYENLDYLEIYIFGSDPNIINLITAEVETRDPAVEAFSYLGRRPFYIYYPCYDYLFIFSIKDISSLLKWQRVVFFFESSALDEFLSDGYAALPSSCVNFPKNKIDSLRSERNERQNIIINELKKWYKENDKTIINNILSGRPRIFFASGFKNSIILERYIANVLPYFENAGCDVQYDTDKSLIHINFKYSFYEQILEYKPDIVFVSIFSRGDYDLPDELFFASWVIESMASVSPPTKRDLVLPGFTKNEESSAEFSKYCKDGDWPILPLLTSPHLFKKCELSRVDAEKYCCDIAILVSVVCLDQHRKLFLYPQLGKLMEKFGLSSGHVDKIMAVLGIIDNYIEELLYNEQYIYKLEDVISVYKKYFNAELEKHEFNDEFVRELATVWWMHQIGASYRRVVIRWVIDAGFTNLKIYGFSVGSIKEFSKYDMGCVDTDEVQKLYSGAKITVGTTYFHNTSFKMLEAVFCDCMYIVNHIDERYVHEALPSAYKDGENIVFFYNREDMIKKLKYYLEHDEERIEMARRTKETAIEHSSYKPYIAKIMDKLKEMARDL